MLNLSVCFFLFFNDEARITFFTSNHEERPSFLYMRTKVSLFSGKEKHSPIEFKTEITAEARRS